MRELTDGRRITSCLQVVCFLFEDCWLRHCIALQILFEAKKHRTGQDQINKYVGMGWIVTVLYCIVFAARTEPQEL